MSSRIEIIGKHVLAVLLGVFTAAFVAHVLPNELPINSNTPRATDSTIPPIKPLSTLREIELTLLQQSQLADSRELQALLEDLELRLNPSAFRHASLTVFKRWATLDPQAALDHALQSTSPLKKTWLQQIVRVWVTQDASAVIAAIDGLPAWLRWAAQKTLCEQPEQLSIEQLFTLAESDATRAGLTFHSDTQRAQFWDAAVNAKPHRGKHSLLNRVARDWARVDPLNALNAVEQLPRSGLRKNLTDTIFTMWINEAPEQAFQQLMNTAPSKRRSYQVGRVLTLLADDNPASAQALLDTSSGLSDKERVEAAKYLLNHFMITDPARAAGILNTVDAQFSYSIVTSKVGQVLNAKSPEEQTAWFANLNEPARELAQKSMFRDLVETDINQAFTRFEDMPVSPQRELLEQSIAYNGPISSPMKTAEWIAQQPGNQRRSLYRTMMLNWPWSELPKATKLANGINNARDRHSIRLGIAKRKKDPTQFRALFDESSDPSARREVAEVAKSSLWIDYPLEVKRYRNFLDGSTSEDGGEDGSNDTRASGKGSEK